MSTVAERRAARESRNALICKLLATGALYREIAAQIGCGPATVSYVARKAMIHRGQGRRPLTQPSERHAAMLAMLDEGKTYQEVADYFNISRQCVEQVHFRWTNGFFPSKKRKRV